MVNVQNPIFFEGFYKLRRLIANCKEDPHCFPCPFLGLGSDMLQVPKRRGADCHCHSQLIASVQAQSLKPVDVGRIGS